MTNDLLFGTNLLMCTMVCASQQHLLVTNDLLFGTNLLMCTMVCASLPILIPRSLLFITHISVPSEATQSLVGAWRQVKYMYGLLSVHVSRYYLSL